MAKWSNIGLVDLTYNFTENFKNIHSRPQICEICGQKKSEGRGMQIKRGIIKYSPLNAHISQSIYNKKLIFGDCG